jgi:hypothetical protein
MICYHTTDAADAILSEGFRDSIRMVAGVEFTGAFLSDRPVTVSEGAKGEQVLQVEFGDDIDLSIHEWPGVGNPRQWCVPAELINTRATVTLMSDDDPRRDSSIQ